MCLVGYLAVKIIRRTLNKMCYNLVNKGVKMREIFVEFHYTANLENFEFGKVVIGMKRTLKEDEDKSKTIDEEFEFVQDKVFDKIDELIDKK